MSTQDALRSRLEAVLRDAARPNCRADVADVAACGVPSNVARQIASASTRIETEDEAAATARYWAREITARAEQIEGLSRRELADKLIPRP